MRVLLFLLLSLFMLSAFSADHLLRWHDAQHYTVQASTPLKAKRAWKLCALYPSLKDSYWLSLNYGMQEAARRYGVDLRVLEAGGGFAPIFPDTCYHLIRYWPAAVDIPVVSDNPTHYADAIRYNARTPLQGSLLPLTRLVWA